MQDRWLGPSQQPLGELIGHALLVSQIIHGEQTEQGREKLRRVTQPLAQVPRAGERLLHFLRGPAPFVFSASVIYSTGRRKFAGGVAKRRVSPGSHDHPPPNYNLSTSREPLR
jgi:hypothetical protein